MAHWANFQKFGILNVFEGSLFFLFFFNNSNIVKLFQFKLENSSIFISNVIIIRFEETFIIIINALFYEFFDE